MEAEMKRKEIFSFLAPYLRKNRQSIFIVVILSIFLSLVQAMPAKITQLIIDNGFMKKQYSLIVGYALFLVFLQIFKSVFSYFLSKKGVILGQSIIQSIRQSVYRKILSLPLGFISENDSVYVNTRMREVNNISELFSPNVFGQLSSIFDFIFISIILVNINWVLYLILLLPIPILFIIMRMGTKKLIKASEDLLETNSRQMSLVNERISGLEFIQTTGKEDEEYKKMKSSDEELVNKTIQQTLSIQGLTEALGLFLTFAPIILYVFGGKLFMDNNITLGGVMTFSVYINRIYSPFVNFASLSMIIEPAFLSLRRVIAMFFSHEKKASKTDQLFGSEIHKIELSNLEFAYDNKQMLLKEINITVNKGEVLQIKGGNGSGKTTLIKLILGLLTPNKGEIIFNNQLLSETTIAEIRKKIAVVSQKTFLFNDTIKNNILYSSKRNESVKIDEMIRQLKIDKIYENHNSDENMLVGENGVKLSGGEIQKIALARALLNDADVFIFDEASSNIDIETKDILKNIINVNLKKKLVIIVDHSSFYDDISDKILHIGYDTV